jgi:sn-glycerol 3-phosphate transport system substrate-binding protein
MKSSLVSSLCLTSALVAGAASAQPVTFDYWYGLTGDLGEAVAATCERFNASQSDYVINCVSQESYDAAVQNTIAAFRAGSTRPLQSFDAGTADLMLSGEFYPVHQLMADYRDRDRLGRLFPRHRQLLLRLDRRILLDAVELVDPVYYFNKDISPAGITEAPLTWEGMEAAFIALKASGQGLPVWPMRPRPGSTSSSSRWCTTSPLPPTTTAMTAWTPNCCSTPRCTSSTWRTSSAGWTKADAISAPPVRPVGARQLCQGECAMFFSSIADHNTVHKIAPEGLPGTCR